MNQNLTARQLAAQFDRAAAEVTEAVGAVVRPRHTRARAATPTTRVATTARAGQQRPYGFAARQIEAVPDGDWRWSSGYDNQIEPLAAAIEFGTASRGPAGTCPAR
ncbi:MAG: hypothetical protein IPH03_11800 [Tetrasphaera sp.]|nr:hypothetical protein [Tetrasphaera sp.]